MRMFNVSVSEYLQHFLFQLVGIPGCKSVGISLGGRRVIKEISLFTKVTADESCESSIAGAL